jgi:hypothetical protein
MSDLADLALPVPVLDPLDPLDPPAPVVSFKAHPFYTVASPVLVLNFNHLFSFDSHLFSN